MRLLFVALAALVVAACQTVPMYHGTLKDPEALKHWTMDGRLGYHAGDNGGSASFHWIQKGRDQGSIHFSGPLGFGSAVIGWEPGRAWMNQGHDHVESITPGMLAWRLTGMRLPIDRLLYWVRGLPAPSPAPASVTRNNDGRPTKMEQAGWSLTFDRYGDVAGVSLPHRIKAVHDNERFVLVVQSWQPQP